MKKTHWIAGGAALAAMLGVAAYAAPDGPPDTRAGLQAKIAEQFGKADRNGDGFVTRAEFDAARAAMRAKFDEKRAERRERRFAMLDTDKNGMLSKEEYLAPRPRGEDRDGKGGMRRGHDGPGGPGRHMGRGGGGWMGGDWFARADADKDGRVSLAEASAQPLAMFDRMDTNKDGTISPAEHEAMRAQWKARRGGEN